MPTTTCVTHPDGTVVITTTSPAPARDVAAAGAAAPALAFTGAALDFDRAGNPLGCPGSPSAVALDDTQRGKWPSTESLESCTSSIMGLTKS